MFKTTFVLLCMNGIRFWPRALSLIGVWPLFDIIKVSLILVYEIEVDTIVSCPFRHGVAMKIGMDKCGYYYCSWVILTSIAAFTNGCEFPWILFSIVATQMLIYIFHGVQIAPNYFCLSRTKGEKLFRHYYTGFDHQLPHGCHLMRHHFGCVDLCFGNNSQQILHTSFSIPSEAMFIQWIRNRLLWKQRLHLNTIDMKAIEIHKNRFVWIEMQW